MSRMIEIIDRVCYPDQSSNWDDWLFRDRILRHSDRHSALLDLGAGAGVVEQMNFKGIAARVCGVDLDPRVVSNPMLDEGRVADVTSIPFDDEMFDIVFADNVIEHLSTPLATFREVHRVLKPTGVFLFKTPNRTHYMPTVARLTPHRFHQIFNRIRGRDEADTFPTLYRANSAATVRSLSMITGFAVDRIERVEGRPEYLRVAWPAYIMGVAYERFVNLSEAFAPLRILLIAELRKLPGEHLRPLEP